MAIRSEGQYRRKEKEHLIREGKHGEEGKKEITKKKRGKKRQTTEEEGFLI